MTVPKNSSVIDELVDSKTLLTERNMHAVCRGESKGTGRWRDRTVALYIPKCRLIHHIDPYLKVGPFRLEVHFYLPFKGTFHDFYSEKEMQWMVKSSIPLLSPSRPYKNEKKSAQDKNFHGKKIKKPRIYGKAVIAQLFDIKYTEEQIFYQTSKDNEPLMYDVKPLTDPYKHTIADTIIYQMSKRAELATQLNVTKRYSSMPYQTTYYGLAGIIEPHMDPVGYEKGTTIVEHQKTLIQSGDMIATFMGWMANTELGGATAFTGKSFEKALIPKKGSAAFWINLSSCHSKDQRSVHAGCPVLKGSKWILNKWIMSYNQWKGIPCDLMPNVPIRLFADLFHF